MKTLLLDANVPLRFLRNDDPAQSPRARNLILAARDGKVRLVLSALTIAEVFYALKTSYKATRAEASGWLEQLLLTGLFEVDSMGEILDALRRTREANVDFGDAMLAARSAASALAVATFDKDFGKFPDIVLHDWSRQMERVDPCAR